MKKLLILVIALALVGGVAMAQVTISGQVELRTQNSFEAVGDTLRIDAEGDEVAAATRLGNSDSRVQVNAKVDDYTSAVIRMRINHTSGTATPGVDRAHFTVDLGGLLGTNDMGVGIETNFGYNEIKYADVAEIDAYNLGGLGVFSWTGLGNKTTFNLMDMVNVYVGVGTETADLANEKGNSDTRAMVGLDGGIDVGVGDAIFELVYATAPSLGTGHFGVAAGLVGAEFVEDLTLGVATAWTLPLGNDGVTATTGTVGPTFLYNATLSAAYAGLAQLDLVLGGQEESVAQSLGIGLGLNPIDLVKLQFGVGLALDTIDKNATVNYTPYLEAFNSFDASATVTVDKFRFRLGYFFLNSVKDTDIYTTDKPVYEPSILSSEYALSNAFSGLYMRARLSF